MWGKEKWRQKRIELRKESSHPSRGETSKEKAKELNKTAATKLWSEAGQW